MKGERKVETIIKLLNELQNSEIYAEVKKIVKDDFDLLRNVKAIRNNPEIIPMINKLNDTLLKADLLYELIGYLTSPNREKASEALFELLGEIFSAKPGSEDEVNRKVEIVRYILLRLAPVDVVQEITNKVIQEVIEKPSTDSKMLKELVYIGFLEPGLLTAAEKNTAVRKLIYQACQQAEFKEYLKNNLGMRAVEFEDRTRIIFLSEPVR